MIAELDQLSQLGGEVDPLTLIFHQTYLSFRRQSLSFSLVLSLSLSPSHFLGGLIQLDDAPLALVRSLAFLVHVSFRAQFYKCSFLVFFNSSIFFEIILKFFT
jgi:hypothetical protein